MSSNPIDFYVDIKSPYAYLALDPAIKIFDQLSLKWNLWPYTLDIACLLYTSLSPRDVEESRMPSSA